MQATLRGRARAGAALIAAVVGVLGCASSRGNPFDRSGGSERTGPTVLQVDNQSSSDMTVYILPEGGVRERLGLAAGLRTTRFTVPERLVSGMRQLRIEADPIGSTRSAFSEPITVVQGDTIGVQIPPR